LIADNGLELELGKDDVHGRLTRFLEVYPQLLHNAALSGAIADLRYSHGFALRPVGASKDLKS
jgi:cell division protein FtsQ